MRLFLLLFFLTGCKAKTTETNAHNAIQNVVVDSSKSIILHLSPANGSVYRYFTNNETATLLEMEGNKMETISNTVVENIYHIHKDSNQNIVFNIKYENIKVTTKKNDVESEVDAANAALTNNPVERMLGMLKEQEINVAVSSQGKIHSITGYEEMGNKLLSNFSDKDGYSRDIAKQQWDQVVINGIVKNNVGQMFKSFPGAKVYRGYRWTSKEKQEGELPMDVETSFVIKEIDADGNVIIASESNIKTAEGTQSNVPGQKNVQTDIKGKRSGIAYVNGITGMIEKSEYTTTVSGHINVMGIESPMSITTRLNITGKKITD